MICGYKDLFDMNLRFYNDFISRTEEVKIFI
ncbi:hypothetical protein GGR40_003469 [Novosphingobium gossypii]